MWERPFAIAAMIIVDLLILAILRYFGERGIIFVFPKSIVRDRTPRWFRFNMIVVGRRSPSASHLRSSCRRSCC
jgi:hypothetical protein